MSRPYSNTMTSQTKQMCISKVPIFNHLEQKEMEEVSKKSKHLSIEKGEMIFHAGDPSKYLYIVHTGHVKVYQLFESGKEQLLRIIEPGEFIGELALFTDKLLDSYAETLEKTEICAIHRHDIQELMKTHSTIPLKILRELSDRLDQAENLIGQFSNQDVEARVASYLVELTQTEDLFSISLPMSKKDLASYLGTTQETISRKLASFQANGWIEQKGHRHVKILDFEALKNIAVYQ